MFYGCLGFSLFSRTRRRADAVGLSPMAQQEVDAEQIIAIFMQSTGFFLDYAEDDRLHTQAKSKVSPTNG